MHNWFLPKSNVDQLYLSRTEGRRGLIGVQDTVETAILGLTNYVRKSKERLIAARTIEQDEDWETSNKYKRRKKNERKIQWTEKQLHGQFIKQTIGKTSKDQWGWLKKGYLERITEALIMATQEQDVRVNNIKAKIDKTHENSICRMYGKAEESVNHVLFKCSKLVQKERKTWHNQFEMKIHWEICRKYRIEVNEKWQEDKPEVVLENDKCKILRDFTVQIDHEIYSRRPDAIVVQRDKDLWQIIDFAGPYDERVDKNKLEKKNITKIWHKGWERYGTWKSRLYH